MIFYRRFLCSTPWCLFLFASLLTAIAMPPAKAGTVSGANDGTGTAISVQGSQFDITGGTTAGNNLFHSFQEFGISAGEIANFISNPNIQNILSRVVGGNASIIDGLVQVTGGNPNLFLMNPAGIVFGSNASLNVPGDFTATTATGIGFGNNQWFNASGVNNYADLTGNPSQFAFDLAEAGAIVNAGNLAVSTGNNLTLIGETVINTGTLQAPAGTITVSAIPNSALVKISHSNSLLSLVVEPPRDANGVALPIAAKDLPELLTGSAVETGLNVTGNTVTLSGVEIPKETGVAIASGTLDASGSTGGKVQIFGDTVGAIAANIEASGTNGGGTIWIGGEQEGQGTSPNAAITYISEDSTITANATERGDGGEIIVFAEDYASIHGNLTARGGILGGDGGFIETSGLGGLDLTSVPDVGAFVGNGGEWLIDPYNINIVAGSGNTNINASSPFTSTGNTANLGVDLINTALATGDVTISTGSAGSQNGDINLNTALNFTLATERTLTLDAHKRIRISNPIQGTVGSAPLNLVLNANNGNVTSGTGNVYITSSIVTRGGDITARGRATTTFAGEVRGIEISSSGSLDSGGGNIDLTGYTPITAFQGVLVQGPISSGGGNITITGSGEYSQAIFIQNMVNSGGGIITFNGTGLNQRAITIGSNVTSGGGDIIFTGYSTNDHAVYLNNSMNSGGGNITITGTTGNASRDGIRLKNSLISGSGNMTLSADRLNLNGTSPSLSGTGNLTLQSVDPTLGLTLGGSGGSSATFLNNTELGFIQDGFASITIGRSDGSGTIAFANNITFNDPITLQSPSGTVNTSGFTLTTNNDTITLIGNIINAGAIASGSGNITLTGNEIDLNNTVAGTGILTLQPLDPSQAILAGTSDSGSTSILDLTATDLGFLQDGFSQVIIGASDSSGAITLANNINFSDPVLVRSPSGSGSISAGDITGSDNATIELQANQNITTGNITNSGHAVTATSSNGSITTGAIDTSNTSGAGGNVNLNAPQDIQVSWIDTQGTTTGGQIDITSQFFRGTSIFTANNGLSTTLASIGGSAGGNITIRHGGNGVTPFEIGNFNTNGIAGAIATGDFTLSPNLSYLYTHIEGNIAIISVDAPPPAILPTPTTTPPTPSISPTVTPTTTINFPNAVDLVSIPSAPIALVNPLGGSGTSISPAQAFTLFDAQFSDSFQQYFDSGSSSGGTSGGTSGGGSAANSNSTGGVSSSGGSAIASNNSNSSTSAGGLTSSGGSAIASNSSNSSTSTGGVSSSGGSAIASNNSNSTSAGGVSSSASDTTSSTASSSSSGAETSESGTSESDSSSNNSSGFNNTANKGSGGSNSDSSSNGDSSEDELNLARAQASLDEVYRATGVKPALLYAIFVPAIGKPNNAEESNSDRLFLMLVPPTGEPIIRPVPINRELALRVADRFRNATINTRRPTSFIAPSQKLYEWLIEPIAKDLETLEIQHLTFLLDSGLRSIPVAALHDGEQFLIERYSLSLMPSMALTDLSYADVRGMSLLAMGAETFDDQNPLPAAGAEVDILTNQLWKGDSYLNEDFTTEKLVEARQQTPFRMIHLATHGKFESGSPDDSFIYLGAGKLPLSQIRNLGLHDPPVELLVLSACETALGDVQAELGFAGLAVMAGVKSALGSLWQVSDSGTLGLMTTFYEQLKEAPIKAEALRRSQLAMIRGETRLGEGEIVTTRGAIALTQELTGGGDLSHPYFWSAFTLIGTPW